MTGSRGFSKGGLVWLVQGVLLVYLVATNVQPAVFQYERAREVAKRTTTLNKDLGEFLVSRTPASAVVLTFAPALPIVASRAPVYSEGRYLIDSYGYMQYVNMGLEDKWLPKRTYGSAREAQLDTAAQEWMRRAAVTADYVVMDDRGRWQLSPETIAFVQSGRNAILRWTDTAIWERR
jgi:hypothetical protein